MLTIDHDKVHHAMREAGDKLEAERQQRIGTRNAAHVAAGGWLCISGDTPFGACTRVAVGRFVNGTFCAKHAPARQTPRCVKPLRCYRDCCAEALVHTDQLRGEAQARSEQQTTALKREIVKLAASGSFGLGDLAEFVPSSRDPRRPEAEAWVRGVLDLAVSKGVVESHGARWRRPRGEQVEHDTTERGNRYQ